VSLLFVIEPQLVIKLLNVYAPVDGPARAMVEEKIGLPGKKEFLG
jgi:hypothetical protein